MEGTLNIFKKRLAIKPIIPSFVSHIVTIDDELPNKEVSNESEKVLVNNFLSSLIDNIHLEYSIISSSLDDVKYFINLFASFFSQMRPIALILGAISKEKVFSVTIFVSVNNRSGK